jgi:hypothetical protein
MESWCRLLQNFIQPLPLAKDRKYNGFSLTHEETIRFSTKYPSFKMGEAATV